MVGVPAYCRHCGALFASARNTRAGESKAHRKEPEPCPNCSLAATPATEALVLSQGALTVLAGSSYSNSTLRVFATLIAKAAGDTCSTNELKVDAFRLDPRLAELIEQLEQESASVMASLLLVMLALTRCNFDLRLKFDVYEFWLEICARRMIAFAPQAGPLSGSVH
jgi:hypothetical protein